MAHFMLNFAISVCRQTRILMYSIGKKDNVKQSCFGKVTKK